MNVLDLIEAVAAEVGVVSGVTSTIDPGSIGDTSFVLQSSQFCALLTTTAERLRTEYAWEELSKDFIVTLVEGQESYALPGDWLCPVSRTGWDNYNLWPLVGPVTPQIWQARQSGVSEVILNREFRIKGFGAKKLHLWGVPTASDVGQTISIEYRSRNWILPLTWTTGEMVAPATYRHYNGNVYLSSNVAPAIAGATPPTHTTGSASDGTVTWAFYDGAYDTILHDQDEVVLPSDVLKAGLKARWYLANEMSQYAVMQKEFLDLAQARAVHLGGAPALDLVSGGARTTMIPEGGYGV